MYPQHTWDEGRFPPSFNKLSKQRMMKVLLAKYPSPSSLSSFFFFFKSFYILFDCWRYLLPKNTPLLENHSHNALYFEKTPITSDLFIPSLNLSLEYVPLSTIYYFCYLFLLILFQVPRETTLSIKWLLWWCQCSQRLRRREENSTAETRVPNQSTSSSSFFLLDTWKD